MAKFNVSCDLLVPVLLEIEAKDEDEAELKVLEMRRSELLKLANTEDQAIGISIDGVSVGG